MSFRTLTVALAAAAWLMTGVLTPPAAAMTLTTSPLAPPASEVILGFDAADEGSYLCTHGSAAAVDVGQTFLAASPTILDKITLKVRAATDDTRGELVTVKLGTFTDAADEEMNEVLAAETAVLPAALVPGVTLYLTLDLEDVSLEAGRYYGFLLGFTGGGNVNDARLDVLHLGEDAYGDGQAVALEGAVLSSSMEHDLAFFLHGSTQVAGNTLLLHSGRFEVEVAWENRYGGSGMAVPVALTDASGYFFFSHSDNVELVIKVLDACFDPYQHFWVFAAGLTDVEVAITVLDTVAMEERTYFSPLNQPFMPILDTAAFATCE